MSDPLYGKPLLRLAADAIGAGRLSTFDIEGSAYNPACGDRVAVTMKLSADGRITAFAHETHACILAQASASILGAHVIGADKERLRNLRKEVSAMLLQDGEASSPFSDYSMLKGAAIYRNRHSCVLLPIDAVLNGLSSGQADQTSSARATTRATRP